MRNVRNPAAAVFRLRARVLAPRVLDLALRLGSGQRVPEGFRARFLNGGVAYPDMERVLGRIRGLSSWPRAWCELAEEKETLARRADDEGCLASAVEYWLAASAAYNYAQFILFDDLENKRRLYERCASAYAWAAHRLCPPAGRVEIPFGELLLPGYLRLPEGIDQPPLVVNVNGANSCKEEFRPWEDKLLARGLATLTFDSPGSGEIWGETRLPVDFERVGTAVADYLETRADVDPMRLGLFGPSLGGLLALRAAAHDRRYGACAVVSAPYDASVYWHSLSPLTKLGIGHITKLSGEQLRRAVAAASVRGLVACVTGPLLVVGGGRDTIVPGDEAKNIHAEATCRKELWFYPKAGHLCLDVGDLTSRVADWLMRQLAAIPPSTAAGRLDALGQASR